MRSLQPVLTALVCGVLLSACGIVPQDERQQVPLRQAREASVQAPVDSRPAIRPWPLPPGPSEEDSLPIPRGPITLPEAMSRALKYNLSHRLHWPAQPVVWPENNPVLPESLTAEQPDIQTQLTQLWASLDAALNYFQQQSTTSPEGPRVERDLLAGAWRYEQALLREVRAAWWRGLAAQSHLPLLQAATEQVEEVLQTVQAIQQAELLPPERLLNLQIRLRENLQRLHEQGDELVLARARLARLLNLPPQLTYRLQADPSTADIPSLSLGQLMELQITALRERRELQGMDLNLPARIPVGRQAILELLPGTPFHLGVQPGPEFTTLSLRGVAHATHMADQLQRVAREDGEDGETEQAELHALLVSAVLAQVQVALENHLRVQRDYEYSRHIHKLQTQRQHQSQARLTSGAGQELEQGLVQAAAVQAGWNEQLQHARLQASMALLLDSLGTGRLETVRAGLR